MDPSKDSLLIAKDKGFTLLELLITLGIVVILVSLAVSLNSSLIAHYRREVAAKRLISALNAARSAAISQGQNVTLCPSEDKKTCDDDWQHQLLIFIGGNKNTKVVNNNAILHVYNKLPYGRLQLGTKRIVRYLRFTANGFPPNNQNNTFFFCYKNDSWKIRVNGLGRIYPKTKLEQADKNICY